jgi:hypothetical protein
MSESSDTASDTMSNAASDVPEDLQQLWNEAIEECEQVERLYTTILSQTAHVQELLSEEDGIMVTYQGIQQDLMDVLDSIHMMIEDNPDKKVGPMLIEMLDSCEFRPVNIQNGH